MSIHPQATDTDDEPSGNETSIEWLRGELQIRLLYIDDPDLKRRTADWIESSFDIRAASVEEHIETRLAKLEADYKMYNHDGVDDGTDAFPDACEGCPHYGGGCPIVTQSTPQKKLAQLAEEADSPTAFKRGMRTIASRYECHRIPEWMAEWDNDYKDRAVDGFRLFREVATDVPIGEVDAGADEPKLDLQADVDGDSGGRY